MNPGIYTMPAEQYHKLSQLSSSLAQIVIEQSPLHAWTACPALNPNFKREEKEVFDIGAAAHALLLEGEDRMAVIDAEDWRTKAAREERAAARAKGWFPVLAARYVDVVKMRDVAVRAIADCKDLSGLTLALGRAEIVLVWDDSGVPCRARIDFLAGGELVVLDYKSTTDATPAAFSRQIARMGYHYQDEFYSRGVQAVFGKRPRFIFMAQETTPPYACSFHGCAPSLLAVARQEVERAIATWHACTASNVWPAHDQRIHWAEAMPWQLDAAEERASGSFADPSKLYGGIFPMRETDPA